MLESGGKRLFAISKRMTADGAINADVGRLKRSLYASA